MYSALTSGLIASTLLYLSCQDLGVSASGLVALTPKYQEVPTGGTLTVLFRSQDGLPITECGFKVDAPLNTAEDSISWTSSSTNTLWRPKTPRGSTLFQGKYFGKGLDAGECGVRLSNVLKLELIGVLVVQDLRVELDFFTVYGYRLPTLKLAVRPSFQTVPVGSDVDITCTNEGNKHINGCTFRLPNTNKRANFHQGDDSDSTDRYQYQGRGLGRGQCGIRLLNVTQADSGWYVCSALLLAKNGSVTHLGNRQSVLLVTGEKSSNGESQEAKHKIEVYVNETVFDVGNTMVATCTITGPYPLPDTVWLLGDKTLPPQDSSLKALRNAWLWEEQSWTLELNTEIGMQLNDLPLRCEIRKNVGCKTNQVHVADHKMIKVKPNCGFRITVEYDSTGVCKSPAELLEESTYVDDIDKVIDQSNTEMSKRKFEGYPWHAGIYKFKNTSSTRSADGKIHNLYSHICGGTLITKRHVLTAAHCFGEKAKRNENDKYKVALGKYYRDYGQFDCRVQWREIGMKQVHVHPRYVGHSQAYMFDIAVIDLRQHAILSTRVGLACVDWELQYSNELLKPGNSGWLSGWGLTSKYGDFSPILRTLALPYKDTNECLNLLDEKVIHLLTSDKFCAGFRKRNISACPGDSGGGLLFNHTKLGVYYVSGVTSSSFRPANFEGKCFNDEVTSFTTVSVYLEWLKDVVHWKNKTALYSLFYKQPPIKANFKNRTIPRKEPLIIVWEKP